MPKALLGIAAGAILFAGPLAANDEVAMPGEPLDESFELGSTPGDPLDNLPARMRLISHFGERAVFSPDSTKIAFVGKSYGDVFEYDIASGAVRNLTNHMPHSGFLRVHYMHDGSLILTGPVAMGSNPMETRFKKTELWWLDAAASRGVERLDQFLFEGVAVSPVTNRIAWVYNDPPGYEMSDGARAILRTGEVVKRDGRVGLENVRDLLVMPRDQCVIEVQDFLPDGSTVTTVCYGGKALIVPVSGGPVTEIPMPEGFYAELEGIMPDGKRSLFECGVQGKAMEICLLELKTDNPRYTRITRVTDYGDYRFSNPQASRDGSMMAFQFAKGGDEPGIGRGILLMDLPKGF
jgi:hypothetical protein